MKIFFLKRSFSEISLLLFIMSSMIIVSGCESIPPGIPPEGPIVSINTTDEKVLTPENAINDMTTAVSTSSTLYEFGDIPTVNIKGEKIPEELKDTDNKLGYLTSHLFRNLIEMNMIKLPISLDNTKVDFIISSTFSRNYDTTDNNTEIVNWKLVLLSPKNNQTLWKQKLKVRIEKKSKEKEISQN